MCDVILRLPEVKKLTGRSRSTLYLRVSKGTFPSSVALGARAVGWRQSDPHRWLAALQSRVKR